MTALTNRCDSMRELVSNSSDMIGRDVIVKNLGAKTCSQGLFACRGGIGHHYGHLVQGDQIAWSWSIHITSAVLCAACSTSLPNAFPAYANPEAKFPEECAATKFASWWFDIQFKAPITLKLSQRQA